MTKIEELAALKKKVAKIKKDASKELKAIITKEVKELFARYPECKEFYFLAYAPYFNDGDPCVFGLRTYGASVAKDFVDESAREYVVDYDFYDDNVEVTEEDIYTYDEERTGRWFDFCREVMALYNMIEECEELVEEIWCNDDSGIKVAFTTKGVSVESYTDHD